MYTEESLQKRKQLKKHPTIKKQIDQIWGLVEKTETGRLGRSSYVNLFIRVCKILNTDFDFEESMKVVFKDFERDSQGLPALTYDMFYDSLFELADLWVPVIDGPAYSSFLDTLFRRMTVKIRHKTNGDVVKITPSMRLAHESAPISSESTPSTATAATNPVVSAASPQTTSTDRSAVSPTSALPPLLTRPSSISNTSASAAATAAATAATAASGPVVPSLALPLTDSTASRRLTARDIAAALSPRLSQRIDPVKPYISLFANQSSASSSVTTASTIEPSSSSSHPTSTVTSFVSSSVSSTMQSVLSPASSGTSSISQSMVSSSAANGVIGASSVGSAASSSSLNRSSQGIAALSSSASNGSPALTASLAALKASKGAVANATTISPESLVLPSSQASQTLTSFSTKPSPPISPGRATLRSSQASSPRAARASLTAPITMSTTSLATPSPFTASQGFQSSAASTNHMLYNPPSPASSANVDISTRDRTAIRRTTARMSQPMSTPQLLMPSEIGTTKPTLPPLPDWTPRPTTAAAPDDEAVHYTLASLEETMAYDSPGSDKTISSVSTITPTLPLNRIPSSSPFRGRLALETAHQPYAESSAASNTARSKTSTLRSFAPQENAQSPNNPQKSPDVPLKSQPGSVNPASKGKKLMSTPHTQNKRATMSNFQSPSETKPKEPQKKPKRRTLNSVAEESHSGDSELRSPQLVENGDSIPAVPTMPSTRAGNDVSALPIHTKRNDESLGPAAADLAHSRALGAAAVHAQAGASLYSPRHAHNHVSNGIIAPDHADSATTATTATTGTTGGPAAIGLDFHSEVNLLPNDAHGSVNAGPLGAFSAASFVQSTNAINDFADSAALLTTGEGGGQHPSVSVTMEPVIRKKSVINYKPTRPSISLHPPESLSSDDEDDPDPSTEEHRPTQISPALAATSLDSTDKRHDSMLGQHRESIEPSGEHFGEHIGDEELRALQNLEHTMPHLLRSKVSFPLSDLRVVVMGPQKSGKSKAAEFIRKQLLSSHRRVARRTEVDDSASAAPRVISLWSIVRSSAAQLLAKSRRIQSEDSMDCHLVCNSDRLDIAEDAFRKLALKGRVNQSEIATLISDALGSITSLGGYILEVDMYGTSVVEALQSLLSPNQLNPKDSAAHLLIPVLASAAAVVTRLSRFNKLTQMQKKISASYQTLISRVSPEQCLAEFQKQTTTLEALWTKLKELGVLLSPPIRTDIRRNKKGTTDDHEAAAPDLTSIQEETENDEENVEDCEDSDSDNEGLAGHQNGSAPSESEASLIPRAAISRQARIALNDLLGLFVNGRSCRFSTPTPTSCMQAGQLLFHGEAALRSFGQSCPVCLSVGLPSSIDAAPISSSLPSSFLVRSQNHSHVNNKHLPLDRPRAALMGDYAIFNCSANHRLTFFSDPVRYAASTPSPPKILTSCLVLGPPLSGKTTLAKQLSEEHELTYLTIPMIIESILNQSSQAYQLLRPDATSQTQELAVAMTKVDKPSASQLVQALKAVVTSPICQANGWVLDGFPETEDQARLMKRQGIRVNQVFSIRLGLYQQTMDEVRRRAATLRLSGTRRNFIRELDFFNRNISSLETHFSRTFDNLFILDCGAKSEPLNATSGGIIITRLGTNGGRSIHTPSESKNPRWPSAKQASQVLRRSSQRRQQATVAQQCDIPAIVDTVNVSKKILKHKASKFDKYCPVCWKEEGALRIYSADLRFTLQYRGLMYRICGKQHMKAFQQRPAFYIEKSSFPTSSELPFRIPFSDAQHLNHQNYEYEGHCPVSLTRSIQSTGKELLVVGDLACSVAFRGRLYCFASDRELVDFMTYPHRYLPSQLKQPVDQATQSFQTRVSPYAYKPVTAGALINDTQPANKDSQSIFVPGFRKSIQIFGFESPIVQTVIETMSSLSTLRIKHPAHSAQETVILYAAAFIKAHNPKLALFEREIREKELQSFLSDCDVVPSLLAFSKSDRADSESAPTTPASFSGRIKKPRWNRLRTGVHTRVALRKGSHWRDAEPRWVAEDAQISSALQQWKTFEKLARVSAPAQL